MTYSLLLFVFLFLNKGASPLISPEIISTITEPPLITKEELHANLPSVDLSDVFSVPDLYFECHIAKLNMETSIPLFYDATVRNYIDLYFTERKSRIAPIIEKAGVYFPLFQDYLEKNNLPPELKFLPILESSLSPEAVSPSEAKGLWQFKKETGIYCGLRIDDFVDERTDPEASTIAACKYLGELYNRFNDWHLALLAYQAGQGTIRRAVEKSGGKTTYHELFTFLPEQTQKYLPAYIAMIYIFTYYDNH